MNKYKAVSVQLVLLHAKIKVNKQLFGIHFNPYVTGYPEEHRIYFRRLSQTTQTDVLLGNLDLNGSGKVVLQPLTVQDRIRELNLKARMFTDTMLAIQATTGPRHSARSLQVN